MANRQSMSNTVRDTTKEARQIAKDIGRAASAGGGEDIDSDLKGLRELAQQIADRGTTALTKEDLLLVMKNAVLTTLIHRADAPQEGAVFSKEILELLGGR